MISKAMHKMPQHPQTIPMPHPNTPNRSLMFLTGRNLRGFSQSKGPVVQQVAVGILASKPGTWWSLKVDVVAINRAVS